MQPLITLRDIHFKRGKRFILKEINLAIYRGEIAALIGRNGVGKTTLLSIIAGLRLPSQGQCDYPQGKPRIAWVGDKPALYPDWTLGMFLAWQAEQQKVSSAVLMKVVAQCQLQAVLEVPCKALSHGYRQRASLAQALLVQPDILLTDEPANGLDMLQKQGLRDILREVAQTAAVVMIHHDIDEVLALADRIYQLEEASVREIPLPSKALFWCEWQNEAAAAQVPNAVYHFARFTAHRGDYAAIAQLPALTALTPALPAAAFPLYQQAVQPC